MSSNNFNQPGNEMSVSQWNSLSNNQKSKVHFTRVPTKFSNRNFGLGKQPNNQKGRSLFNSIPATFQFGQQTSQIPPPINRSTKYGQQTSQTPPPINRSTKYGSQTPPPINRSTKYGQQQVPPEKPQKPTLLKKFTNSVGITRKNNKKNNNSLLSVGNAMGIEENNNINFEIKKSNINISNKEKMSNNRKKQLGMLSMGSKIGSLLLPTRRRPNIKKENTPNVRRNNIARRNNTAA
jgi:hypothetical protein